MNTDNKSRAEFEAWISGLPFARDIGQWYVGGMWPLQYVDYRIELAWQAWQAARKQTMTLKHTPCDCDEYRRIESACGDLIAERTTLRNEVAGYKWRAEEAEKSLVELHTDAERYRWLVQNMSRVAWEVFLGEKAGTLVNEAAIHAEVDRRMG